MSLLKRLGPLLVLSAVVLLVYGQAVSFDFTNWDDPLYVSRNPLLVFPSRASIDTILTPAAIPNEALFVPVAYLSFLADAWLPGEMDPAVFHRTNVLLHLANVLLAYVLCQRVFGGRLGALLGALLFAVHPLQVEAVAWVMGRKDVLGALFGLLTLLALDLSRTTSNRVLRHGAYLGAFLAAVLAMFSKPTFIVLPALAVLADVWRDGAAARALRGAVLRALPLAGLALVCVLINGHVSSEVARQIAAISDVDVTQELDLARAPLVPAVLLGWILRLGLLSRSAIVYPEPLTRSFGAFDVLASVLLAGLAVALWWAMRSGRRRLWFGALFGLLAFGPAAAMILVDASGRPLITADRFGYFSMAGLGLLVTGGAQAWHGRARGVFLSLVVLMLLFATDRAHAQVRVWRDSESLWTYAVQARPNDAFGHISLGQYYYEQEDLPRALACFQDAVRAQPEHADGHRYMGVAYLGLQQPKLARRAFLTALQHRKRYVDAHLGLGVALALLGERDAAVREWRRVLKLAPEQTEARFNLGLVARRLKDWDGAIEHFSVLAGRPVTRSFVRDESAVEALRRSVLGGR